MRFDRARLRPGVVLSLAVHAGFLAWLAIVLAFHDQAERPKEPDDAISVVSLPPPPPPPPQRVETKRPTFQPQSMPALKGEATTVPPLILPPVLDDLKRPLRAAVVTEPNPIVVQPKVLSRTNPEYPPRAADREISGHVDIEGTVAPDGSFSDGKVIAEDPEGYGFASALFKVMPKWRFEPKTIDGRPVPYHIRYRFSFAMRT